MNEQQFGDQKPPKLAIRLLRMIFDDELFDDVYGDLHEIYIDRLESKGLLYAQFHFTIDAIASIRNYNLRKRKTNSTLILLAMIFNYFKSSYRNIKKNWSYSLLNILGLALGIAACLFILQYVSYERSYDKFHTNHEDLYRVRYMVYRAGELNIDCAAAVPRVGPFMKEKMPEVVDFARVYPMSGIISFGDVHFRETRMHMTDPAFLKMFSYPLIKGDVETALKDPFTVVITESMAKKYFGSDEALGKTLRFNDRYDVEVTGVTTDVPDNSHFKYDFLVSFETLNTQTKNDNGESASETSWGWYDYNTYVQLRSGTDPNEFDRRFDQALVEERKEDFEKYNFKSAFPLQPITDIHLYSNLLQESEPEEQGDGRAVEFLSIIAFFILLIAWINYINLATAKSADRSKEVGVRKTLGATKKQLVFQFLTESFVLNGIAMLLALLLVATGIGYFNQLTGSNLNFDFLFSSSFWGVAAVILFAGSLLSGLYPAVILSSYKPVSVLKGKLHSLNVNNILRKSLVVFQFTASIALIAGTIIVYQQLKHMRHLDLGFEMTDMLVVQGPWVRGVDSLFETKNIAFKEELNSKANIARIASGSNIPGDEIFWTNSIRRDGRPENENKIIYNVGVDYNYFPTYNIDLVAGRNYDINMRTDTSSIILNAEATRYLGFESPEATINQKVFFWGKPWNVVGVVDDYNQMTAKDAISPLAFHLQPRSSGYYTMKLKGDDYSSTFTEVQQTFESFFPGNPFKYFFLDDFFNRQYNNDQKFSRVFTLFAAFAIFVACLGLFGLSSFNVLRRSKEIGVRKVLGATVTGIVRLLSKEFIILLLIANVLAWPLIYFGMSQWLEGFASRISISFFPFLIAGLMVVIVAMTTISFKIVQAALANPVESIRDE